MYTFSKKERLCSTKLLEQLFHSGHRIMMFPYSVHWMVCPKENLPSNIPVQVLIATSKRKFHHAVDRNRVKRLTRECYRIHKPQLYQFLDENGTSIILAINYVHNEILEYSVLMHKFDKLTTNLINDIAKTLPKDSSSDSTCQ